MADETGADRPSVPMDRHPVGGCATDFGLRRDGWCVDRGRLRHRSGVRLVGRPTCCPADIGLDLGLGVVGSFQLGSARSRDRAWSTWRVGAYRAYDHESSGHHVCPGGQGPYLLGAHHSVSRTGPLQRESAHCRPDRNGARGRRQPDPDHGDQRLVDLGSGRWVGFYHHGLVFGTTTSGTSATTWIPLAAFSARAPLPTFWSASRTVVDPYLLGTTPLTSITTWHY